MALWCFAQFINLMFLFVSFVWLSLSLMYISSVSCDVRKIVSKHNALIQVEVYVITCRSQISFLVLVLISIV